jgi:hypothetical protein
MELSGSGDVIGLLRRPATARLLLPIVELTPMYRGVERRITPRHQGPRSGVILLEADSLIACTVRDFSPTGVGLMLPEAAALPPEFALTFDHTTRHCITVWRRRDRMGVKLRSAALAS